MNRARTTALIVSIAATLAAIGAAPASAGQFLCIPDTAGAGVTSGGTTGTCSSGTPLKVPASAADQQTLIDLLPYLSFRSSGVGAKPTVVFKGVNVQLVKRDATAANDKDGTGNLVIGRDYNPFAYQRTGSENLAVGIGGGWQTNGNAIVGAYNYAEGGSFGFAAGANNHLFDGTGGSILGGFNNYTKANYSTVVGGRARAASTAYQYLADDVHWASYDSTGKLIASSEPASTMTSYANSYYSITQWSTVPDVSKCALSVQVEGPDGQLTTAVAAPWYTSYVYVRFNKPSSPSSTTATSAANVPHTVTAVCGHTN
jgi:hypothetical protein